MTNITAALLILTTTTCASCGLIISEEAPITNPTPSPTPKARQVSAQEIIPPKRATTQDKPQAAVKKTPTKPTAIVVLQTSQAKYAIVGTTTFKKLVRYSANTSAETEIEIKTLGKINLGLVTAADQIILTGLDITGINQLLSYNPADSSETPLLKDDIEITQLQNPTAGQLTFTGTRVSDYNTVTCVMPLGQPAKYSCKIVEEDQANSTAFLDTKPNPNRNSLD